MTENAPRPWLPRTAATLTLFIVAGLSLIGGYLLKRPCLVSDWGPPNYVQYTRVCYSDLQALYGERKLNERRLPYIEEKSYEYPVLIGFEMYAAARFANSHEGFFLANIPFLAGAAFLALGGLIGAVGPRPRVLWFAAGTPLLFYSFHNWDLLAVAPLALSMWAWARRHDLTSAGLLGLGAAAKLFPGYTLPSLMVERFREERRVRNIVAMGGCAAGAYALVNLPVIIADTAVDGKADGWIHIFSFHSGRTPDFGTTYYWLAHTFAGTDTPPLNRFFPVLVMLVAAVVTAAIAGRAMGTGRLTRGEAMGVSITAFVATAAVAALMFSGAIDKGPTSQDYKALVDVGSFVILVLGTAALLANQWFRRVGAWATGGAVVALFLLVSKVHSPQFAIWLVLFFVVVRTPAWIILVYLLADAVLLVSGFWWFAASPDLSHSGWQDLFAWSVFLRALGLALLIGYWALRGEDLTLRKASGPERGVVSADLFGESKLEPPPVAAEPAPVGPAPDGKEWLQ